MSRPPLSLQAPLLRFVATSLVFGTAVLGLAACGDDDDGDTADGSTSKATATATSVKGNVAAQSALGKKINETAVPESMANGRRLGAADAKVVIEAYEDFGCPHCLDFTANIEPRILQEYVTSGKVAFEYRYFPLRQLTAGAAIAAECASAQNKFWPFHRALFIAQAEAAERTGPSLTEAFALANLKKIAADAGLDPASFETCVVGDTALNAVQADLKKANELGLPGTPSFVINGQVTPTPEDFAAWKKLLDSLLK